MNTSNLFIISGPSGAGEDSIINGLHRHFPIEPVVTTTTRPMRLGESDGIPYYFVSKDDFEKGVANNEFAEWAEHYNGNLYGVTHKELERVQNSDKVGIWKIDYKGVMHAKKLFPDIVAIFVTAPLDILEERIRRRGEVSEAYVRERMAYTKEWLQNTNIYDHTVENVEGQLEKSIDDVAQVIQKYRET